MLSKFLGWATLLSLALLAIGCGEDGQRCYPASGVIVDEHGQPVKEMAGWTITLLPEGGSPIASATIDENGEFVLSTRKEGDGAVAGKHSAQLDPPDPENEDAPKQARRKDIIDSGSTTHEVTIEPRSNEIKLTVKRLAGARR